MGDRVRQPVTLGVIVLILSAAAACGLDPAAQPPDAATVKADVVPPGFLEAQGETNRLLDEGLAAEAVVVMERFLEKTPDYFDAHFMLARAHEALANQDASSGTRSAAAREARARSFEAALRHYQRYLDLYTDAEPTDRAMALDRMIRIARADGLNRLADADVLTRKLIETTPDRPNPYIVRAEVLRELGLHAEATAVLVRACKVVRRDWRGDLGGALVQQVKESPHLTDAEAMALLDEASAIADEMVARDPRGALGLLVKSHVLGERTRFVRDPRRRSTLRAEADRFSKAAAEALKRPMP